MPYIDSNGKTVEGCVRRHHGIGFPRDYSGISLGLLTKIRLLVVVILMLAWRSSLSAIRFFEHSIFRTICLELSANTSSCATIDKTLLGRCSQK